LILYLRPVLLLFAVFTMSCSEQSHSGHLSEGIIEYKVEYISDSAKALVTQMLPKTMTLKFKNNLSVNRIAGFFGFFEIANYANARKGTNSTCLKIIDNKYSYSSKEDEPLCCFDPFDGMTIVFHEGESRQIAGYNCNRATAHFEKNNHKDFDIYYTNEINVKSPNSNNPFRDIHGVLMQFSLKMRNLNMEITADAVKPGTFKSSEFEMPKGYKAISKQKMEEYLFTMLE
jgi:GLPGLI family protein